MITTSSPTKLTREEKEAVGLLSIGTFLEYFDLMLYVHMAVLLNDVFFPKIDPFTTRLLSALAFCSIFLFRPFGALLFGWIGDNIGRKSTVIITTFVMALSCLTIFFLPTYAEIGITASYVIFICRIMQGMSSIGEIIGAEIYISETIPAPLNRLYVALLGAFSVLGGTVALGFASLVFLLNLNWRIAFAIGACIALVGSIARTTLREAHDFADARKRLMMYNSHDQNILISDSLVNQKVHFKDVISLFMMDCSWAVCFYVGYIYCGDILSNQFNYTASDVISHNFCVSLSEFAIFLFLMYLGSKGIEPLKILKIFTKLFLIFLLFFSYTFTHLQTPLQLGLLQAIIVAYGPIIMLAVPVLFNFFPIFKRFSYVGTIHAVSRAIVYVVASFGVVFLTDWMGHISAVIVLLCSTICFMIGLNHFDKKVLQKHSAV